MTQNPSRPGPVTPIPPAAKALLDGCFEQYRAKLTDIGRASIEMSGDLFEGNAFVDEKDVAEFKAKRSAWVERFDKALGELYERRLGGGRRKGRRPDFDASISTLRVLTAFDQEKQAALVAATAFLYRLTRRELDALDLRVETLLPAGDRRDPDNPFGPPYILDAIGLSARATYPNPRLWRPFMERVVADVTPAANKIYITLNRYLADHGVLPEIKAELRARSEFRPADDKDLIPTFSQMLHDAVQALPGNVEVPQRRRSRRRNGLRLRGCEQSVERGDRRHPALGGGNGERCARRERRRGRASRCIARSGTGVARSRRARCAERRQPTPMRCSRTSTR